MPRGLQAVAEPALPAVDGDGGQDDQAVDDLLDGRAGSVADQHGGQHGEEQRADARARVIPRPAEHRPSDDHRDHALEQVRVTEAVADRAGEPADQQAHEGRRDRAERERRGPHPPGADQRVVGRPGVRAGRQQAAAQPGPVQQDGEQDQDDGPDDDGRRNRKTEGPGGRLGQVGQPRRGIPVDQAAVQDGHDPDGQRAHGQRDDQRVDREPVADIAGRPAQQAGPDDGQQQGHAERQVVGGSQRGHGERAGHDLAGYPQVEAADQDQQGLPAGGEPHQGGEDEDRADGGPGAEPRQRDGAVDEDHDERHDLGDREPGLDRAEPGPGHPERGLLSPAGRDRLGRPIALGRQRVRQGQGRLDRPLVPTTRRRARAAEPASALPGDRAAEYDRDDEDAPVDDLQVRGVDREGGQEVLHQVDGERAEERADQAAAPADQGGAAEHHGRDRDQGVLGGARRVGRVHQAGQGQAADPGEQAAEPVARHPYRVDVDAAGKGRRVIAPDGVQQPPQRDQPQAEPDEQGQPDGEHAAGYGPYRPGEVLDPAAAAERDRVRGDEQNDALEAEEHRERDDDRLDPQHGDEQAVQ